MNKAYLKRLIFRLFALVMAFGVVYSVQNPASAVAYENAVPGAVRPQQGWYVSGTMSSSVSGTSRKYFIIDTKMSDDPWYVEHRSSAIYFYEPFFQIDDFSGQTYGYYSQFYPVTYWRGYSQVDWVLDRDWLVLYEWDGITRTNCKQNSFVFWDASKIPIYYRNFSSDGFSSLGLSGTMPFLLGVPVTNRNTTGYRINTSSGDSSTASSQSKLLYNIDLRVENPLSILSTPSNVDPFLDSFPLGGVSINDLCFALFPNYPSELPSSSGDITGSSIYGRVAVRFAVPVDKAPADTQVGDSWPKIQSVPVQIQGSLDDYKAWKDNALAQTPVSAPAEVTSQIEGYNQQLDAADQWGTLETNAWNEIVPILDSFDFVFTILGIAAVVFVLLLFIKKGMA